MAELLWRDVVFATRRLRASPSFVFFAVASLALGIAVTTVAFSLVASLLWPETAVADADRVAVVAGRRGNWHSVMSHQDYVIMKDTQANVLDLVGVAFGYPPVRSAATDGVASLEAVSGGYFSTLGVPLALGRSVGAEDNDERADAVVISTRYWRTQFQSDPDVLRRALAIDDRRFQVVGVAAPGFRGLRTGDPAGTDLWIPLTTYLDGRSTTGRSVRGIAVLGRLLPGSTIAAFGAEVGRIARMLDGSGSVADHGAPAVAGAETRNWTARTLEELENSSGRLLGERIGFVAISIVGLVLIVAATNLANLILGRGVAREGEIGLRAALGGSRWRLVREQVIEGGLLALCGGVVALLVAKALMLWVATDLPFAQNRLVRLEPELNTDALLATLAATITSLLVMSVVPAVRLTRCDLREVLASSGSSTQGQQGRAPWLLVRWQVAIAASLFALSSLFANSLLDKAGHDPGVDLDRLTVSIVETPLRSRDDSRFDAAAKRIVQLLQSSGAVESAMVAAGLPFGATTTPLVRVTAESAGDQARPRTTRTALLSAATPEVFATLGVSIVKGRPFDEHDMTGAEPVAVISAEAARQMFGTSDVIGRRIAVEVWSRPPRQVWTVVGVASDTDVGQVWSRSTGFLYVPFGRHRESTLMVVARTFGDPSTVVRQVRQAIHAADAEFRIITTGDAKVLLAGRQVLMGVVAKVAAGLGALTFALALVGLNGALRQAVAMRKREIGIRLALGAQARENALLIVRVGLGAVASGLVIAFAIAFGLWALVRATLPEVVESFGLVLPIIVSALMLVVAALTCYVPARRAANVDPLAVLRAE